MLGNREHSLLIIEYSLCDGVLGPLGEKIEYINYSKYIFQSTSTGNNEREVILKWKEKKSTCSVNPAVSICTGDVLFKAT